MQRGLHCAVEFLRKYLPGVLAAVFILVAALTWGIRAGADVATATEEEGVVGPATRARLIGVDELQIDESDEALFI